MVRASSLPVQQQSTASTATTTRFDLSVGGFHSACSALRTGRRGLGFNSCHPSRIPAIRGPTLSALALALFGLGLRPRAFPASWAAFVAFVAFVAFLGPGLKLAGWVLDLSPTTHVGNPPLGTVEVLPLVVLGAIAAALGVAAAVGFRRRVCLRAEPGQLLQRPRSLPPELP